MLRLYYHPFSSFCQKVLIALYENGVAFEREIIDLGDPAHRQALERLWPFTKFPVLHDETRNATVPEASLIVEYLGRYHAGPVSLIPEAFDAAIEVRLLDRVFDNYILMPVTKVVTERLRASGRGDPDGVEQAKALISTAYRMLEERLPRDGWAAGEAFTLADCAAAPALFYSNIIVPFGQHRMLAAYYGRLTERPSFARVVDEARPYRHLFPLPWPPEYA